MWTPTINCAYCERPIDLDDYGYGYFDDVYFHSECLELVHDIPIEGSNVWDE